MTWGELDLERGIWTVPAVRTKNGRTHVLPLSHAAIEIIEAVPRRAGRDYLFGERAEGFTLWSVDKRKLDARLAGTVQSWRIHDLRRSAATGMADLGVQPHVIEAVLNHYSGHRSGVAGIYNRSPYEREARAALAMWSDHIRALVDGGERRVLAFEPRVAVES